MGCVFLIAWVIQVRSCVRGRLGGCAVGNLVKRGCVNGRKIPAGVYGTRKILVLPGAAAGMASGLRKMSLAIDLSRGGKGLGLFLTA